MIGRLMLDLSSKRITGSLVRLTASDNVVVARTTIPPGTELPEEGITSRDRIQAGYKIAARPIAANEPIVKYNVVIGFAACDIAPGSLVHSHNTTFREFARDYDYCDDYKPVEMVPATERATFQGYVREDGRVGTELRRHRIDGELLGDRCARDRRLF